MSAYLGKYSSTFFHLLSHLRSIRHSANSALVKPKLKLKGFIPAISCIWGVLSGGSAGKESACNVGDLGSILGLGRSSGEGKGYPLQCSSLENSMGTVHGVAKNQMWLSGFDLHFTGVLLLLFTQFSVPTWPCHCLILLKSLHWQVMSRLLYEASIISTIDWKVRVTMASLSYRQLKSYFNSCLIIPSRLQTSGNQLRSLWVSSLMCILDNLWFPGGVLFKQQKGRDVVISWCVSKFRRVKSLTTYSVPLSSVPFLSSPAQSEVLSRHTSCTHILGQSGKSPGSNPIGMIRIFSQ